MTSKIITLDEDNIWAKDSLLRHSSTAVDNFDSEFQKEVDSLLDEFDLWKIAVGLSAPQIGILKRFFVLNIKKSKGGFTTVVVNPELTYSSENSVLKYESCISIPKRRALVPRPQKISLKYQDRFGKGEEMDAEGFLARVILHEMDHLNGILFVDILPPETLIESSDVEWG